MKNLYQKIYNAPRSKTPCKLSPNLKNLDEMILNLRKHTIPTPFELRSSQRECREAFQKHHQCKKDTNTQKSASRLVSFSPQKLTPKSLFSQMLPNDRPSTCSPTKIINLIEKAPEDKSRAKIHIQWKKILTCVKKTNEIWVTSQAGAKKKPMYTIDKVFRSDL